MSREAWGDDGDADRPYMQKRVDEIVAEEAKPLLGALEKIAGGFINSDCLMSDPSDWHSAFAQLQAIAREAIEKF